jgi:hypothetical protein
MVLCCGGVLMVMAWMLCGMVNGLMEVVMVVCNWLLASTQSRLSHSPANCVRRRPPFHLSGVLDESHRRQ